MAKPLTQANLDRAAKKLGLWVRNAQVEIRVGVPDVTHHSGLRLPELAAIHEFGTDDGRIPERAPFRTTMRENVNAYKRGLAAAAKASVRSKGNRKAYELLGAKAAGDVQSRIAQGLPPPNAPSTVAQKGSDTPLIDEGDFRQSITWEVRNAS